MKKLIIFIGVLVFANTKLISQKIIKDSIIINLKVDNKTFQNLKNSGDNLNKTTKSYICKNSATKKLINKYNIIYNYKTDKSSLKVEIKKGSCDIH